MPLDVPEKKGLDRKTERQLDKKRSYKSLVFLVGVQTPTTKNNTYLSDVPVIEQFTNNLCNHSCPQLPQRPINQLPTQRGFIPLAHEGN